MKMLQNLSVSVLSPYGGGEDNSMLDTVRGICLGAASSGPIGGRSDGRSLY